MVRCSCFTNTQGKSNVELQKTDFYMSLDNSGYMGWIGDLSFECVGKILCFVFCFLFVILQILIIVKQARYS